MSELTRQLYQDHRHMNRLLDLLTQQIDLLEQQQDADYGLLEDVLHYMIHYADEFHHARERLIFDALLERDPSCHAAVDRLGAEHEQLAEKSLDLYQTVRRLALDGVVARQPLIDAARDYYDTQRAHMRFEEAELFARADRLLSDADQAAVDDALAQREDPIFGSVIAERYRQRFSQLVRAAE